MSSLHINSAADAETDAVDLPGRYVFYAVITGIWNSPLTIQFKLPDDTAWTDYKTIDTPADDQRLWYQEFGGVQLRVAMASGDFAVSDDFVITTYGLAIT